VPGEYDLLKVVFIHRGCVTFRASLSDFLLPDFLLELKQFIL